MSMRNARALRLGAAGAALLLAALLLHLPLNASAQGACTVLSAAEAPGQLDGLHCITGVTGDAELLAGWSFTGNDLNSRPVTVSLSAAKGQQVQVELLLPGGST